ARYFIAKYTRLGDMVVDPFCGKGTAVFEAARLQRYAIGGDIAPDAALVTRAKCAAVSTAEVIAYIEQLRIDRRRQTDASPEVRLFFSRRTLQQLLCIRDRLLEDVNRPGRIGAVSTFVCGVLLGVLHGHSKVSLSLPSNQCFAMSLLYVR